MKKLTVLPFLIIFLLLSLSKAQKEQIIEVDVSLNPGYRNQPIIFTQEIEIEGNTVFIKNTYDLRYAVQNFSGCSINFRVPRDTSFWDYEVLVNGSSDIKYIYLESFPDKNNEFSMTRLPCKPYNSSSIIIQTFYSDGLIKEIRKPILYPFDKYLINSSWKVDEEYPMLFMTKVVLPQNTFPDLNMSRTFGPFMDPKTLMATNKTSGKIIGKITDFTFFGKLIRPAVMTLLNNRINLIYPQLALAPKNSILEKLIPVTGLDVVTTISWERPLLIKFIWFISISFILLISYYFLKEKMTLSNYLIYSLTIWGFQEGINQLIPSVRPLNVTVFELPIIITFLVISYGLLYKKIKKI